MKKLAYTLACSLFVSSCGDSDSDSDSGSGSMKTYSCLQSYSQSAPADVSSCTDYTGLITSESVALGKSACACPEGTEADCTATWAEQICTVTPGVKGCMTGSSTNLSATIWYIGSAMANSPDSICTESGGTITTKT